MSFPGQSFQFNQTVPVVQATTPFVVNSQTVSYSYVIPQGSSVMSTGPVSIASGVTVTISSGSRWVVL